MYLSNGHQIGLQNALRRERNILHQLKTSTRTSELQASLWSSRAIIEGICAHHLGADASRCLVGEQSTWMRGQFNICVPVTAQVDGIVKKMLFRCPIPHKSRKLPSHTGSDEKVRVEVANYAYVEANCPEIPTAGLIGFGFSDGHHVGTLRPQVDPERYCNTDQGQFTHRKYLRFSSRISHRIKCLLYSVWYWEKPSCYAPRSIERRFGMPYMLLDFIDARRGRMLSESWSPQCYDARRGNLYRDLSRLTISLARHRQSHIGALRFNDDGLLRLSNPPALCGNTILESETGLRALKQIYTSSSKFVYDMLAFRDRVLEAQPNAANNADDCRLQMAYIVLLRALVPQLMNIDDQTSFVMQFTDLHASNIFVDEAWNITGIIDLEFMCSLPVSMLDVPHWLTAEALDDLAGCPETHLNVHNTFMETFQHEETALGQGDDLSRAMQASWDSGAYWPYHGLTSVDALPSIVEDHFFRLFGFSPSMEEQQMFADWLSMFWSRRSNAFVTQKVADKEAYAGEIREFFKGTV
nr:hypothetical protein CFP56_71341 [Quercus suber]